MTKPKFAVVQFNRGYRKYCYMTDLDLQLGDTVIVDSSNGMGIAQVFDPDVQDEEITNKATAWILCKVDTDKHYARLVAFQEQMK